MSFPAYLDSKPTGDEWLEDIPAHWNFTPLRRLVVDGVSNGLFKKKDEFGQGTLLVNVFDVYQGDFMVKYDRLDRVSCTDEEIDSYEVRPNDLFFVRSSLKQEGVAIVCVAGECDEPVVYECHLVRARPNSAVLDGRFASYVLNSAVYRAILIAKAKVTTMTTIDQESIVSTRIPVPPPDEQKAISSFLDVETSKIDGLVSEQRRLTRLLKEKRQAVISHSVTKGLNPNAPMKPSGIQWLGEVPQHWGVKPVRYACEIDNTLRTPIDKQTRSDIEGDHPYYGPTGILSWINKFVVQGEYFLLGEDGDHFLKFRTQPMTVNVAGQFNVNNHAHLIKGKGSCSTKWASLYFEHKDLLPWLIKQGVGRYKLRKEKLFTIPILVPPPGEQDEILAEADRVKATTTSLMAETERAIDLLQERRTALISAAVTGKIDVREFAYQETA